MMSDFAPPSVSEMFAYAYGAHRGGSWSTATKRQEALVEHCVHYALQFDGEGQALMRALGRKDTFTGCSRQNAETEGRPDLLIRAKRRNFTVELKLEAGLTRGQRKLDYANYFIAPKGRLADLKDKLPEKQNIVSWEDLLKMFHADRDRPNLLVAACELAIASAHPSLPLPDAKCLSEDEALKNIGKWISATQEFTKQSLGSPLVFKPSNQYGPLHIQRNFTGKRYGVRLDLTSQRQPAIFGRYKGLQSEEYSIPKTELKVLAEDLCCEKESIAPSRKKLLALKWGETEASIGKYTHAFFATAEQFVLRSSKDAPKKLLTGGVLKVDDKDASLQATATAGKRSVRVQFSTQPDKDKSPFKVGDIWIPLPNNAQEFRNIVWNELQSQLLWA